MGFPTCSIEVSASVAQLMDDAKRGSDSLGVRGGGVCAREQFEQIEPQPCAPCALEHSVEIFESLGSNVGFERGRYGICSVY